MLQDSEEQKCLWGAGISNVLWATPVVNASPGLHTDLSLSSLPCSV